MMDATMALTGTVRIGDQIGSESGTDSQYTKTHHATKDDLLFSYHIQSPEEARRKDREQEVYQGADSYPLISWDGLLV